jgi:Zn-dependent protease with chaperone function
MSEPPQQGAGVYFDGQSNRKRRVVLRFGPTLEIVENDVVVDLWPYEDIRRVDGVPALLRLKCLSAAPLARLEIEDEAAKQAIALHCPKLDDGMPGSAQTWRIVGWSAAAVCSIVVVVMYGIPFAADRLAAFVPFAVEKRLGDAVDKQVHFIFGDKICNSPAGQQALTTLVDRLKHAGDLAMPLEAQALSTSIPNAFALPGGRIYVTNGLLQKARNPDEIAGVLAHELGHVEHRDGLRKLIQTGGTSFFVGLLFGDVLGGGAMIFATRSLLNVSYSRDAERSADAYAAELMHKLGRSPKPMAELLFRITGAQADKNISILSTHPLTEERLAVMEKEDRPATGPDILSANEWLALQRICATK